MANLRSELTPLPERMRRLPVDPRGYPVPRFVQRMANGEWDFRIMDPDHWMRCVTQAQCWVCGERLGARLAFVIGPMCGINRVSSEPPSHRECAEWSAINCPFLSRPHMVRREDERTREAEVSGIMIARNPAVTLLWITRGFRIMPEPGKILPLIQVGDPEEVLAFREGRAATREEVRESIDGGFPLLLDMAKAEGTAAVKELYAARLWFESTWLLS